MAVIASVDKERSRYRVTLDDGTVIPVSGALYRERPLAPGDEIDPEEYDNWLLVRQYRQALDRAVALLASRPHSRGEIGEKLTRAGYRPGTVEMVLYKLEKERLLDDADFARQWVQSRAGHKLGQNRIAAELRRKGVSAQDAQAALAQLAQDEQLESAAALARKSLARAGSGEDPRKTASRILAMLARRGYGYDLARKAIERAKEDADAPRP